MSRKVGPFKVTTVKATGQSTHLKFVLTPVALTTLLNAHIVVRQLDLEQFVPAEWYAKPINWKCDPTAAVGIEFAGAWTHRNFMETDVGYCAQAAVQLFRFGPVPKPGQYLPANSPAYVVSANTLMQADSLSDFSNNIVATVRQLIKDWQTCSYFSSTSAGNDTIAAVLTAKTLQRQI